MTDLGYLIWFIATALMVIAVLAVGTLGAAGMLNRHQSPNERATHAVPAPSRHESAVDSPGDTPDAPAHQHAA